MSNNPPPQHNNGTHNYDNWVLLLRQGCNNNNTNIFVQGKNNWKNVGGLFSGGDPETDNNYSILGTFIDNPDDYRQSSGTHQNKFHFALRYSSNQAANQWIINNFDHNSHTSKWKVWFQTFNPNSGGGTLPVDGYVLDDSTYNDWNENTTTTYDWGGIAVGGSGGGGSATWDGTPASSGNWFWAIGITATWNGGIPADGVVRPGVELWINTHNTPAYAGSGSGGTVGPLDISLGITGWYDGYSYDNSNSKWTDKTGLANDLSGTDITGTLTPSIYHKPAHLVSYRNNKKYMQKMFKYIAGSTTSRITFPTDFLADTSYTLFHVARRDPNGIDLNGRIFDGSGSNWYSGFNDASSGVTAHDLSYINTSDRKYGNNWVVSVDRPNYYRSIGYSDFSSGYYDISSGSRTDNASPSSVPQLTINKGSTTYPLAISNLISTGGIKTSYIYNNETYITHTFLSDGSFTVIGSPITADVLVVGAGGHGGSGGGGGSVGDGQGRTNGGGGGAGQLYYNTHTLSGDIYNIIIGEPISNNTGENSKIISPTYTSLVIDASGGGSGGQYPNNTDNDNGQPGGSGGGSCGHTASGGTADARSSVNGPYYGNNGGSCSQAHTQFYTYGAGGGGADASGNDGTTKTIYDANTNINFCDGGDGKLITIRYGQPGSTEHSQTPPAGWDTGDVQYYAGGGGGSAPPYGGDGGKGGGGRGDNTDSQWGGTPVAGTTNTGGGGGGRRGESGGHGGASGGSGIVVIRYKINVSDLSSCDWNVAEVFAYNKHLSGSEEDSLADYLKFKYLGTNQVSTGDPHIYQLTHDISAVDASNTQQMIKGLPPDISAQTSLIGWYIPEGYNTATNPGFWTDATGHGYDLSNCGTSPELVAKDSTYNWISYIRGSKGVLGDDGSSYSDASGFIFPENLLPTDGSYTIIHVSRRVKDASGNATGRIFDSASNKNFYSGFVGSKSGVALHSVDVSASR